MNVSKNKFDPGGYEAQLIENMEFDVEGQKLSTRRGLGAPIYTFESDILYIWNDYELNLFLVFLKNKNIYKTMHDRISNEATYTRQNRTFLRQKRSETAKRITKSSNDIIKASTIIYQI